MGRAERAEDIIRQYIDKEYNKDVVEALINDFKVNFGLVDTHEWFIGIPGWFSEQLTIHTGDGGKFVEIKLTFDNRIGDIDLDEQVLYEIVQAMNCPMCEAGKLEHRAIDNPQAMNEEKKTHMYICNQCPMVALEWYDTSDTEAFNKELG